MEDSKFVDFAKDDPKYNYELAFRRLYGDLIQKDLLRWCIYSISLNDPAHDLAHVLKVCQTGVEIFNHYRDIYGFSDLDEIIVHHACLMHDLGCRFNRRDHHVIGYGLVYDYISRYCPGYYDTSTLTQIAICVLEHRSSNKSKPSTLLSEVVSVADSGRPDFFLYLSRALKFRLSGKDEEVFTTRKQLIEATLRHIEEKYGENGYNWKSYPNLGLSYYKEGWDEFKNNLSNHEINLSYLETRFDEYKNEKWNIYKDLL